MLDRTIKFKNLKEMIKISKEKFGSRPAFYINGDNIDNSDNMIKYNRYGYLEVYLTNEYDTRLEDSKTRDHIILYLNINDIYKTDVHYIISYQNLTNYNNDNINFDMIYEEDDIAIFYVNYITKM